MRRTYELPQDGWLEIDESVRRAVSAYLESRVDSRFDEDLLLLAEDELRELLSYPAVLLASSATAAAHAVFLKYVSDGHDRVALPTHVYPGIAGAAVTAGLKLRFVQVDRDLVTTLTPVTEHVALELIHLPWGDTSRPMSLVPASAGRAIVLDVSHAVPRVSKDLWSASGPSELHAIGSLGPGKFLSGMELGFVAACNADSIREVAALGAVRRHRHFGIEPPIATKLRPHPLALVMLRAQLKRLPAKLQAHDETWSYLVPRLGDIPGVRVVTTSAPSGRIYWRCALELTRLDGTAEGLARFVAPLRDIGIPVSAPEYLDDVLVTLQAAASPLDAQPAGRLPQRYVCLPGYVRLSRADCDRLLYALAEALA